MADSTYEKYEDIPNGALVQGPIAFHLKVDGMQFLSVAAGAGWVLDTSGDWVGPFTRLDDEPLVSPEQMFMKVARGEA